MAWTTFLFIRLEHRPSPRNPSLELSCLVPFHGRAPPVMLRRIVLSAADLRGERALRVLALAIELRGDVDLERLACGRGLELVAMLLGFGLYHGLGLRAVLHPDEIEPTVWSRPRKRGGGKEKARRARMRMAQQPTTSRSSVDRRHDLQLCRSSSPTTALMQCRRGVRRAVLVEAQCAARPPSRSALSPSAAERRIDNEAPQVRLLLELREADLELERLAAARLVQRLDVLSASALSGGLGI